jgi:hypothetical protein
MNKRAPQKNTKKIWGYETGLPVASLETQLCLIPLAVANCLHQIRACAPLLIIHGKHKTPDLFEPYILCLDFVTESYLRFSVMCSKASAGS